jgi:HD-like signal output (HDOD) protein
MPILTAAFPLPLLTPDQVVQELRHLPSAPKVLPRLKRLLSDSNSVMSDIVALIRLDPAIAARVLQTANSAHYNRGQRCSTVDEAVHRVGYSQVYELVANAVASQVLVRPLAAYQMEPDELWRQSVACALATQHLAMQVGEECDTAYTIGLLHCVGRLAVDEWILQHHPGHRLKKRNFPGENCEAERALLGFTQAEAGSALLRHWDFPPAMSEPIRCQYEPFSSPGYQRLSSLLHVAKWVRSIVLADPDEPRPPAPDARLLRSLRLTSTKLENCAKEVGNQLKAINSLLDLTPTEIQEIEFPGGSHQFTR